MDPKYLLDTNICIYVRQNRPEQVMSRFRHLRPGEAALSVITFGELIYGANKSAHRLQALQLLRDLATLVPALPLPETTAENYGLIRSDLEARGEMIGNNDLWIAAHALSSGLTLVTSNEREFRRIRRLQVENWVL